MLRIGITGGIACGKSAVSKIIEEMNHLVIDTDLLAKEIRERPSIAQKIAEVFKLTDPAQLRNLIFSSASAKFKLERILHPEIRARMNNEIEKAKSTQHTMMFVAIPLLFEVHMEQSLDRIVTIYSSKEQQLERLLKRPGMSQDLARSMIQSQLPTQSKAARSHDVVFNTTNLDDLKTKVHALVKKINLIQLKSA